MGFVLALLLGAAAGRPVRPLMTIEKLRCELAVNPLGVDEPRPRFDWRLASPARGVRQTAYRVLVASDPKLLKEGRADRWDSGRVPSDRTFEVLYDGVPLRSRERLAWRVEAWDESGAMTTSPIATFEMGLLEPGDWRAKWISLPPDPPPTERPAWIWSREESAEPPAGTRFLRTRFHLAEAPRAARLAIAVDDSFEATLNGKPLARGQDWRRYVRANPLPLLRSGENELLLKVRNVSGPAGAAVLGDVTLASGARVAIVSGSGWEASRDGEAWEPAVVRVQMGEKPYGELRFDSEPLAVPYFRRDVNIRGKVRRARAFVTARGLYDLTVDGSRVGDRLFAPGDVDFRLRQPYNVFDVTGRLAPGKHALGLRLGEGWYSGNVGAAGRAQYGPYPEALVQLEIEYADGTKEAIVSDERWRVAFGGMLSSDILMGEAYDARREPRGWDSPGFDPSGWSPATAKGLDAVPLEVAKGPPVAKIEEIRPVSVSETSPGTWVFDLGQNMVGWARLKVQGDPGTRVKLRFAEMLNPDGTIYTANLRGAKQTDEYVLDGRGEETWEPRFTFHGFRYIEVTGYPGRPGPEAITGVVVASDTSRASRVETSSELVNKLDSNIRWGQRGNYLEIPTDCPQRDERLGWMADAQVFAPTAAYNADIQRFMTKWLQDVRDAVSPEGAFPDVAPRVALPTDGAPAWGDAGVIVPWQMWLVYGDRRGLERAYPSMRGWVELIAGKNPDRLWRVGRNNDFGDWLSDRAETPKELLGTAYFARSAELLGRAARVLGKGEDAARYEALREEIAAAFRKAYVRADGEIAGDTQTGYILPLAFDLLTPAQAEEAKRRLVDDIVRRRDGHLSTGFLGVGLINPVLSKIGRSDVAYRLLLNDTYPSWGFSIRQGATTIWERWDGWTPERGFQDPGMNSFNHYALGSVGEWTMERVLGIGREGDEPGFRRIVIQPETTGPLGWARGYYDSISGRIEVSWRRRGDELELDATIPPNATALVRVPAREGTLVREGDVVAEASPGVLFVGEEAEARRYRVGSGSYRFRSRAP